MRKRGTVLALLVVLALALPVAGQMQSGSVAQIFANKPKPGMTQQYEQGRKKHMAWHRSQGDKWEWQTWEIMTGARNGQYIVGTFGHNWKDFDGREKFEAEDTANAQASMGASEEASVQSFYVYRTDLSIPSESKVPAAMVAVTHFYVKAEGAIDFAEGVKKVNEGAKKSNWPGRPAWYQLANGGEGPEFVLVQDRNSYAEFQPPDKSLDAMMAEVYGKEAGAATMNTVRKAIRYTRSELLRYRPDLSYVPGAAAPAGAAKPAAAGAKKPAAAAEKPAAPKK